MRPVMQWLLRLAWAISTLLVVDPKSSPSSKTWAPPVKACMQAFLAAPESGRGLLACRFRGFQGRAAQVLAFADDSGSPVLGFQLQGLGHR